MSRWKSIPLVVAMLLVGLIGGATTASAASTLTVTSKVAEGSTATVWGTISGGAVTSSAASGWRAQAQLKAGASWKTIATSYSTTLSGGKRTFKLTVPLATGCATFLVRVVNAGGALQANTVARQICRPVAPASDPFVAIGAGQDHACAVQASGHVACWGDNFNGELGDGTKTDSSVPVIVDGLTDAVAVGAGDQSSCALRRTGAVVCWGGNFSGGLGNGSGVDSSTPVAVTGITNATAIAVGGLHACALLADGTAECWGYGYFGQLGGTLSESSPTPVAVKNESGLTGIAAGSGHTCLAKGGTVDCLGSFIADAQEPPVGHLAPVTIAGLSTATQIAGSSDHACARKDDGTVVCWGTGVLGDGTEYSYDQEHLAPVTADGVTDAVAVGTGWSTSCAVRATGGVLCWGGAVGNGTTDPSLSPVAVSGLTDAVSVTGGLGYMCALRSTGGVVCWGRNDQGQLGSGGSTSFQPAPVALAPLPS